jgi:hypothetical protein
MRPVCILYEDQRGPHKGFGLHALVRACVADTLGERARHEVEKALADYRPLKGYAKLLEACRRDLDLISNDGRTVIAVFDNDQIRRLLELPKKAPDAQVAQAIREGVRNTERLLIVLLKQNMESVILAAHHCDPSIDKKRIVLATEKKDLLERDTLLTGLAAERFKQIRDCILEQLPSFRELVGLLCAQLQAPARTQRKKPAGRTR